MANQEQSRDGIPHKDKDRPSPDRLSTDGQGSMRGSGLNTKEDATPEVPPRAGEEKGVASSSDSPSSQDYRGDGPGKMGLTSANQPDLVEPGGVNARNHSERGDAPVAGETLNFDDGTDMVHPRGKVTGAGRTRDEANPSDAGDLGAPGAGLSDRNGPSDPDAKRDR